MIISVVSIDGNGNGDGLIKVPMMGNVKLGLKLEGIKVAEGGCIVEGKANLSGVSLSVLNDKQREEMQKVYDTFRLVTQTAKQYAPEIATALNKAIAVVDAIGDLSQKISEKKRNTKALLEHFAIAQEPTLIQNCKEIADDSKALQDSLEKTIELVKSGKIKAKLADLQAACVKNVAFMNKLAPALAQCQGLSEPNLRDPKSCGPCADPWDMMPTNIVFVCNEAMNKVFGVESTSLLLPPDGDDNPQTENTSPQVATKSLFFEVQTGCDTDEKLTHVYTTTNSLGERFEYTACKLGDVTYFHYKGGEYWYYKGQYYKSNDHYNQTKQRIEQGFEMYNWNTRTYDYVNLPIGKLTLEQLADALGEFYYSTFGGMAGAEAGLVLDVLNNVYIQTDLSCRGTNGDSYRSCLVSNAPKEFAKMVALGTLAVGVYKSANFIWNKSVNILKLGSGGALNLVEKFKSLNTSKVRPPAFENKDYAEFLDDFAGNIKDFEGSGVNNGGVPTRLIEGRNVFRGFAIDYSRAKTSFSQFRENQRYLLRKKYLGTELVEKIQEFDRRNLAYFEGKIDNLTLSANDIKVSGNKFEGDEIFSSYKVDKSGNIGTDGAWSREFDTEYVGLSEIAQKLGAKKGMRYEYITGEITIASELPYCISCQGVIQDFANMFPNIKINLVDGLKNIKYND